MDSMLPKPSGVPGDALEHHDRALRPPSHKPLLYRYHHSAIASLQSPQIAVRCRNPDTQLALLDRLAGTDAAVAQYTEKLEQLRAAHAQLAAIDALGNEEQRERLQALVDQVGPTLRPLDILRSTLSGLQLCHSTDADYSACDCVQDYIMFGSVGKVETVGRVSVWRRHCQSQEVDVVGGR